MRTSFVAYHGHGFWCHNEILSAWLLELADEAEQMYPRPEWLTTAIGFWRAAASMLRSQRFDLVLQGHINDAARQRLCAWLFDRVLNRSLDRTVRRAAVLARSLILNELPYTRRTPPDYWTDREWQRVDVASSPLADSTPIADASTRS